MSQLDRPDLPPIPETLDEAVDQIVAGMTEEDKAAAQREDPEHPFGYAHFGGGMAMRNGWGLWHGRTPISRWLREHGIWHGDDASAVIFKALYCRLTGKPFDIAAEAAYYRDYWASKGCGPDGSPLT